jgi:hypothetical protein
VVCRSTAEKARTTWNLRSPITRASDTLSPWPSATDSVRDARLAAAADDDADADAAADVSPAGAVVDVVVVVVVAGCSLSAPLLPLLEPALGLLSASWAGFCGVRLRKLSLLKSVSPMVSGDPDVGDDDSEPDGDVDDDPLVRNVMAADDSVDDNRSAAALSEPSPPPPPLELTLVAPETFLGAVGSAAGGGCGVAASPLDLRSSFLRSMSPRCCCCCCSWARLTFSDICCSRWSVDRLLRAARP